MTAPDSVPLRALTEDNLATASPTTPPTSPPTGGGCRVGYVLDDWGSGFNANVTITNAGSAAINGWHLVFSFPGAQSVTNIWNATQTQSGKQVTATNAPYNATIPAGGQVGFGFGATSSPGANGVPSVFTLNGQTCAVS